MDGIPITAELFVDVCRKARFFRGSCELVVYFGYGLGVPRERTVTATLVLQDSAHVVPCVCKWRLSSTLQVATSRQHTVAPGETGGLLDSSTT